MTECQQCPPLPGALVQAVNFTQAALERGLPLDEDRVQLRLAECRGCERRHEEQREDGMYLRCSGCGCYLDMIPVRVPVFGRAGRARWMGLTCPKKLWPELENG